MIFHLQAKITLGVTFSTPGVEVSPGWSVVVDIFPAASVVVDVELVTSLSVSIFGKSTVILVAFEGSCPSLTGALKKSSSSMKLSSSSKGLLASTVEPSLDLPLALFCLFCPPKMLPMTAGPKILKISPMILFTLSSILYKIHTHNLWFFGFWSKTLPTQFLCPQSVFLWRNARWLLREKE